MTVKTPTTPKASVVEKFVELIIEQLKLQQVSRAQLAQKAGVGLPYLYRVLNGEQTPSFDWAEKVAAVLGITIDFHAEKRSKIPA